VARAWFTIATLGVRHNIPGRQSVEATSIKDFGPFVLAFLLGACAHCGVGSKYPDPIPSMRGVDGTSWYNNRLRGVPFIFQIR
jgi:hypothetical protein